MPYSLLLREGKYLVKCEQFLVGFGLKMWKYSFRFGVANSENIRFGSVWQISASAHSEWWNQCIKVDDADHIQTFPISVVDYIEPLDDAAHVAMAPNVYNSDGGMQHPVELIGENRW